MGSQLIWGYVMFVAAQDGIGPMQTPGQIYGLYKAGVLPGPVRRQVIGQIVKIARGEANE